MGPSKLVLEWFFRNCTLPTQRQRKKLDWDTIEPPENIFDWHKCPECNTKLPFVLHPNFGLGLIAHLDKFHGKEEKKNARTRNRKTAR